MPPVRRFSPLMPATNVGKVSVALPPELVVTRYLGGVPIAWCCSACGGPIRPAHNSVYVLTAEITEEFRRHCNQEHIDLSSAKASKA